MSSPCSATVSINRDNISESILLVIGMRKALKICIFIYYFKIIFMWNKLISTENTCGHLKLHTKMSFNIFCESFYFFIIQVRCIRSDSAVLLFIIILFLTGYFINK